MTLLEVMIGFALFALAAGGISLLLVNGYKLAAHARYNDEARAVLRTFADQFMRLPAHDSSGTLLALFSPTTTPTGSGLSWNGAVGDSTGLQVPLGNDTGNPIVSRVTREVTPLSPSNGNAVSSPSGSAAGYLIQGRFTLSFTFGGRPFENSVVLVRNIP